VQVRARTKALTNELTPDVNGTCSFLKAEQEKFECIQTFGNQSYRSGDLWSISSTFYVLLLCTQIPKATKIQSSHQCLFALLGPMHLKAGQKMLMKLTPWVSSSVKYDAMATLWKKYDSRAT